MKTESSEKPLALSALQWPRERQLEMLSRAYQAVGLNPRLALAAAHADLTQLFDPAPVPPNGPASSVRASAPATEESDNLPLPTSVRTVARSERSPILGSASASFHEPGWRETPSNPDFPDRNHSKARRRLAPPLDGVVAPIRVQSLDVVPSHEPGGSGMQPLPGGSGNPDRCAEVSRRQISRRKNVGRRFRLWIREIKPTLKLALPIVAGMVAQMLMGLTDTIMVGQVGVIPLAASSFVNAVAHLPFVCALGLLTSMSVLASQAFGARRAAEAGEVLRHGLILAAGAGLFSAAGLAGLRPFLDRFGQPPEVVAAAGTYLVLFGASLIPALVAQSCKQFSEALNRPWMPTWLLLAGVGLNVLLNWILIFGHWGAPALGLEGAGWATLIARLVMAFSLIAYVVFAPSLRAFQPRRWLDPLSFDLFRRLLGLGGPVAAQHLLEVGAFALAALMMGWISAEAIASHQIAITCAATTFMFALGIGMAVCIRVGHAWGAGQRERLRRIGFVGVILAAGVMGTFAVLFVVAGEPIARCFVSAPVVIALTTQLLVVAAAFQIADGIQIAAISALRGLNDVRVSALIAALAYWLIAVPLGAVLAFSFRQGAVGLWIGLATGLGVAAVCLSWRFHHQSRLQTPKRASAQRTQGLI